MMLGKREMVFITVSFNIWCTLTWADIVVGALRNGS